jgi:hypothetical protein
MLLAEHRDLVPVPIENGQASVRAPIIDSDQLDEGVGLCENAVYCLDHVLLTVVDGHDDAD